MAVGVVRVCSWEDVSFSDAETLLDLCWDVEKLQHQLIIILSRQSTTKGEKQQTIELDMFTYAVQFCKKQQFSQEQLSAFFTILKSVHEMCISTPHDNLQDDFVYFRDLVLRHSVQRPPFSRSIFSMAQVKAITDYVLSTYFKHYKMYKFVFTQRLLLSLSLQYSGEPEEVEEEVRVEVEKEEVVVEGSPEENNVEVEEKGEGEREVYEEEIEESDSEQQKLKTIINSTLTSHFKQLKVKVEKEMAEHEKRMSEKISQLETISKSKKK